MKFWGEAVILLISVTLYLIRTDPTEQSSLIRGFPHIREEEGGEGSDECLSIKITSTIVHVSDEQKETQT